MFIECFKNNGKDYLRLVKSHRVTNARGEKVSAKSVIYNIGPLSRFDDGQPDYLNRLKKSFKAGNPLIPELLPYCSHETPAEVYRFTINEGSPDCFGHPKLFSNVLLERMLEELGLNSFFSSYKGFRKANAFRSKKEPPWEPKAAPAPPDFATSIKTGIQIRSLFRIELADK